ncbi:hypothetical protein JGD43_25895 [Salmonella enterica subsp. enterica serovar Goldcoast]|nr:hypothetical protein [Salmonella enterica subsp. enterica serovar Goldcoast]
MSKGSQVLAKLAIESSLEQHGMASKSSHEVEMLDMDFSFKAISSLGISFIKSQVIPTCEWDFSIFFRRRES